MNIHGYKKKLKSMKDTVKVLEKYDKNSPYIGRLKGKIKACRGELLVKLKKKVIGKRRKFRKIKKRGNKKK